MKEKIFTFFSAFMLIIILTINAGYSQTTYTVGVSGDFLTIQEAIDASSVTNGDIISVTDAVHTEVNILVNKNLTIVGQGADVTTVQAAASTDLATNRVFYISEGISAVIEDITITHGKGSSYGGGIFNAGNLLINRCIITDNKVNTSTESLEGGGGLFNSGILTIKYSEISNNYSDWHGGGIWMEDEDNEEAELYIENCIFENNSSNRSGAALGSSYGAIIDIKNTLIVNNNAGYKAGGIHLGYYFEGDLKLNSVTISKNTGTYYTAGVHCYSADMYVQNSIIAGNIFTDSDEYTDLYIDGSSYSLGNNIIGIDDYDQLGTIESDKIGTYDNPFDPELSDDFIPLLSSPAINYGPTDFASLNIEDVDVYGNSRIYDGEVDIIEIGAVELQAEPLPTYLISALQTDVAFGEVPVDIKAYQSIEIKNHGQATVTLDSVFATGGFEIYMQNKAAIDTILYNETIPAHSTKNIYVSILHDTDSAFSGDVIIYSEASNNPEITVNLTATTVTGLDYFSGEIITNTTWCEDTVHIGGDVTVNNDVTLTICAGTVINFLGDYSFTVSGALQSNGDVNDTVFFTNSLGNWGGIRFENIINSTQTDSYFTYTRVENGFADDGDDYNKGGGIYLDYTATLSLMNCEIIDNSALEYGGGIYNAGQLDITNSLIDGNSTMQNSTGMGGGGIANAGMLQIINSAIHNNTTAFHGGGILNCDDMAELYMERDSITNNSADKAGGAIANTGAEQVDIINCLIANNSAIGNKAGGIHSGGGANGIFNIISSTIYGNNASSEGGGISNRIATFNLINTIVAGNTGGSYDDIANTGTLNSGGYNLIGNEDGYAFPTTDGDIVGTSAVPIPAQLNADYTPSDVSIAINHGIADTTGLYIPTTDLAGNSRIFDGDLDIIDIGAFELQSNPSPSLSLGKSDDNIDFLIATIDSSRFSEILLSNLGFGLIEIDSIIAPEGYEVSFEGSAYTDTLIDVALPAYEEALLTIKFTPIAAATFAGNVIIKSNDASEPIQNIAVTGDGTEENVLYGSIYDYTQFCVDTVKVVGDVTIENGATLEFCAGTVVEMQGNYTINVQGRLLAEGTETDTIVFTYLDGASTWEGIQFDNTSSENDSSKICYAIIEYGNSEYGGALYIDNYAKLLFENNVLRDNYASSEGGAIYNNGTLTIEDCLFDNNSNGTNWQQGGGAIANAGNLTIINSVISNNFGGHKGAGICSVEADAVLNIFSSEIIDNTCDWGGGGIGTLYASSINIQNTLIAGNTSNNTKGGGIHAGSNFTGTFTIANSTITDNSSNGSQGGGIFNQASSFYISNTIISDNTGSGDDTDLYINGEIISEGYNFVGNIGNYSWEYAEGDILGTVDNILDPWLEADYSPTDSSMAVNMGNPVGTYPEFDVEGNPRVFDGTIDIIDIGAFEFQAEKVLTNLELSVDKLSFDFEYQQIGENSYAETFILGNYTANNSILISSITAPDGYSITISGNDVYSSSLNDLTLGISNEIAIDVVMNPQAEQEYSGTIAITNNTPEALIEIPISGFGAELSPSFIYTATPPVIDGVIDDAWNSITRDRLLVEVGNSVTTPNLGASYRAMWDADSLYILLSVVDDSLHSVNPDSTLNDNFELYLDFNNSKGSSYDTDDYMIRFNWNYNEYAIENGVAITGMNFAERTPDDSLSYIVEIAIPWASATSITPGSGTEIGIDINLLDNDGFGIDNELAWYSDADDKDVNPASFGTAVLLNESGVDPFAPVMEIAYGNTSFNVACEDSIVIPVTISNNGSGRNLDCYILSGIYETTNIETYNSSGETTYHSFTDLWEYSDAFQLVITLLGDFDDSSEDAYLEIEGTNYGKINENNFTNGILYTRTYTFDGANVQDWFSDNQLDVSIINSPEVDAFVDGEHHQVQLTINNYPDVLYEITQGESFNTEVVVDVSNLPNGVTEDEIFISSNDPNNEVDTIVYTISKQGVPEIELIQSQFNFGEVKANHYSKETLQITNNGCVPFTVDSITSTHEYFFVQNDNFVVEPEDTAEVFVYFLPEEIGEFSEFMTIYNSDVNKTINVQGVTADTIPPQIMAAYVNDDRPDVLVIEFDEEIQVSGFDGFTLNGSSSAITGLNSVLASAIEFTLSTDVVFGELLTLAYDSISENVQDIATLENPMQSITDILVANNVEFIDDVAPTLTKASVVNENPDELILEFDEDVLVTDESGITINGTTGSILNISGSGTNTLIITLDANVLYGETLSFNYLSTGGNITDNAKNPNDLQDITGITVFNYVDYVDVFEPNYVSAKVDDAAPTQVVVVFDEPVITTDESGFTITGTTGTITGVSGSGTEILTFTLDADVVFGENIELSYNSAVGDAIDAAGTPNDLADFGPVTIANNVLYTGTGDPTLADITAVSVEDANPNQIVVTFDENVTLTDQTGFSVSGITANITDVTGGGTATLTFTLDVSVVYGDIVLLSYTSGNVNGVTNPLADFTNLNVINNVAYVDNVAPTLSSATVLNSTPTIIDLVFDENVVFTDATGFTVNGTTGAISTSSGSGSNVMSITLDAAIVYGESITLDYISGNVTDEAVSPNSLATFSNFVVANYVEFVDIIKPQVVSASVENDSPLEILVNFSEEVTYTDFTGITINGTLGTIVSIVGDNTETIGLTLDKPVVYGEILSIDYAPGNITDIAITPNTLDAFTGIAIVNNVEGETINPEITYAVIKHATPSTIVVSFDEIVNISDFTGFTVSGTDASLSGVTGSGTTTLTFTLNTSAKYWEAIMFNYDGLGNITDRVGNILMPVDYPVINQILSNDATLSDLTIDGTTVSNFNAATLIYNVELAYGTVIVPTVVATTTDVNANATIVDASSLPGSTVITTVAEDGITQIVYTINYTITPHTDATLADLTIDGTTVSGFNATTLTYDVELAYGTVIVPTVVATTTDANANATVVNASSLPGSTVITSVAEDGTTNIVYTINFAIAAHTDATLVDLTIDGTTVSGFDAATLTYDVELPLGTTTVPTVVATPTDANAAAVVDDATVLPGATVVTVTAEDETTKIIYTINFTIAPNNVATLSDLTIDGTTVTDFDAATLTYNVELPFGTSTVPTVLATATDANANVSIQDAASLPGSTVVTVVAEDGTTNLVYTVVFTIGTSINGINDVAFNVYPNPSKGKINIDFGEERYNNVKVELISITGETLLVKEFYEYEKLSIDASDFSAGTFILRINADDKIMMQNIIIE